MMALHRNRPSAIVATTILALAGPGVARAQAIPTAGVAAQSPQAQDAQPTPSPAPAPQAADTPPAPPAPQVWAMHGQGTVTTQGVFGFPATHNGPNSLPSGGETRETVDATLFAGLRLWRGAEVWINPEVDQGFGLADTLGVAGFPSGEAYKVGSSDPYIRLQRLFLRQTIDLGGEVQSVDPDQNVLGGSQTANRLVITLGKFSVGDVFDTNKYAHDPRGDFLNWSIIDAGSFDYAADAWGYTYGMAGEWYQGPWALRLGLLDMSKTPNGESPDDTFTQFQIIAEGERRYTLAGQPGKLKVTGFDSRARMGDYADALRLATADGTTPNVLDVRTYRSHAGVSFNLEQQVIDDLGVFARAGFNDGHQQSYEFTDINRTVSLGAALGGKRWGRPDDVVGAAGVINDISKDFKAYLAAGGLGILVGDGQLVHSGPEEILETYYDWAAFKALRLTLDYQFIEHPAYNADRGPASVLGIRVHAAM
jgi:high affinity Mn2+ porin